MNDLFPRTARSLFPLVPVLLLVCFLLIYPYHRGLFVSYVTYLFEGPLYGAMIWLSLTFAVWALLFPFRTVSPERLAIGGKDGISVRHLFVRRFAPFAVFVLPLSYLIASWNAASPHSAMLTFFVWVTYAFVFLMAFDVARDPLARIGLSAGIGLSGTMIVVFGFLNYFGDASLWGILQYEGSGGTVSKTYLQAVEYGPSGLRLTSVFQYANSYAAFLIGFFLLLMAILTHARSLVIVALAALPVVPALLSFLLTQSRGAYVMLPVTSLLFVSLMRTHRQIIFLALSVLAALLVLFLYDPVFRIGLQAIQEGFDPVQALKGWALLLAVSAAFVAAAVLMCRFAAPRLEALVEHRLRFRGHQLVFPLAGVLLGVAGVGLLLRGAGLLQWLPPALRERLETINLTQHSVLERWTFYRDIFKMIGDYPWLGAGGGAWATLYERYQNNPYTSNDPHSFYLQYLLDTGIVGFVLFAAFLTVCLAAALSKAIRFQFEWDAATSACLGVFLGLAIHSAIDFNMNYMFLGVLFFLCLGVLASPSGSSEQPGDDAVTVPAAEPAKGKQDLKKTTKRSRASVRRSRTYSPVADRLRKVNFGAALVCLVAAITMITVSSNRLSAHNLFDQTLQEASRSEMYFEEYDTRLQQAIRKVPNHPFYLIQRTDQLIQLYEMTQDPDFLQEAEALLVRLQRAAPYNKNTIAFRIRLSLAQGFQEKALEAVEYGLAIFPWDMTLYEQAFELHYILGSQAAERGDEEARRRHWDSILRWKDTVHARMEHLASLPEGQRQGKPFEMTRRMKDVLAQIQSET